MYQPDNAAYYACDDEYKADIGIVCIAVGHVVSYMCGWACFFSAKLTIFLHNNLSLAAKISSPERASVWTRPGLDANGHGGSQCRCMPLWIAPMQFYLT